MAGQRVGIFGGTFNPVHIGHLRAAIEVAEAVGLQAVEFVPAARPPHKVGNGLLDFDLRLLLCRLAVEGLPGFSVNSLEARRDGPSYTCDTLTALGRSRPEDEFTFILGMGDLLCLGQWKNGYDLGRLANLAVHARAGMDLDVFTACLDKQGAAMGASPTEDPRLWRVEGGHWIRSVPVARLDICSSDIRERWLAGRLIDHLVPRPVLARLTADRAALVAAWGEPAAPVHSLQTPKSP